MALTNRARLLKLARRRPFFTAGDARRAAIHSQDLTRLVAEGLIERVTRGQYRLTTQQVTEHHGFVIACRAIPRGVLCLLSALTIHGIGTQLPLDIWMAIDERARRPVVKQLPLQIVRFGGEAFTHGVERHRVEGTNVAVYGVAKTIADLFKYRNKVGLDVALEALREAWRDRKFTMDQLDHAARVCRVERVMRPYVEAIVS